MNCPGGDNEAERPAKFRNSKIKIKKGATQKTMTLVWQLKRNGDMSLMNLL
jgi:hypothetical protein